MKHRSAILLILCALFLVGVVLADYPQMPDQIASHFGAAGEANGWTSKSSFVLCAIAVGFGIPAFVMAITFCMRFFPAKFLNVPNAPYWREPANFRRACDFLFEWSMWFGSAFLLWQASFLQLLVAANRASPPHLNGTHVVLLTAALLGFVAIWIVVLVLRFSNTDGPAGKSAEPKRLGQQ